MDQLSPEAAAALTKQLKKQQKQFVQEANQHMLQQIMQSDKTPETAAMAEFFARKAAG